MVNNILFLTEAGDNIGYGHLIRCRVLSECFIAHDINTHTLLNYNGDITDLFPNTVLMDWLNNESLYAYSNKYSVVIVDSYHANYEFYLLLKKYFKKVVVIDDFHRLDYPVDIIVNPNIFGNKIEYELKEKSFAVGGKEYVLLRKAFIENSGSYRVRPHVDNIVITIGGSDYRNLISKLLEILIHTKYDITVITGNEKYKQHLEQKYSKSMFYGLLNEYQMIELFMKADIVISASGQTLNELAYLGNPVIAICIDKDQKPNHETYYEEEFIKSKLFWNDEDFKEKVLSGIKKLESQRERQKISKIGKSLINGNGALNILKILNR